MAIKYGGDYVTVELISDRLMSSGIEVDYIQHLCCIEEEKYRNCLHEKGRTKGRVLIGFAFFFGMSRYCDANSAVKILTYYNQGHQSEDRNI